MYTQITYKFITYLMTGLAAFFMPITWAFIVVIIFVSADTVTGIMKAGKDGIRNIQGRKMFAIVPKLIFYFLLVIVAHSCSYIDQQVPFVKLAMFGIGFIEIKSIDENFETIYGYSFMNKIMEALKALSKVKR